MDSRSERQQRGVDGDTVADIAARLGSAIDEPRAVLLLIGSNDLGRGRSATETAQAMHDLLRDLIKRAPKARIIVQSVTPRRPEYAADIRALNAASKALVNGMGPRVSYLDLWPYLASGTRLRPECTEDGVHLNGKGYRRWVQALAPVLDEIRRG